MRTPDHHAAGKIARSLAACILFLSFAVTACSVTSYSVGGFTTTRTGRYTRNAELLGDVARVAVAALNGQNQGGPDGSSIALVMDAVSRQAAAEIAEETDIEILPLETAAADPVYLAAADAELPQNYYSPVPGLTDLPDDADSVVIADICESLGVDALLFIRFEIDWDFPTWNAATVKTKQHVFLMAADGGIVWESRGVAWMENMVPLPSDFTRMFDDRFTVEEWAVVAGAAAELPQIQALGGAPVFFLRDDIRAAQTGG